MDEKIAGMRPMLDSGITEKLMLYVFEPLGVAGYSKPVCIVMARSEEQARCYIEDYMEEFECFKANIRDGSYETETYAEGEVTLQGDWL
jgi:hypothetical protein